MAFVGAPPLRVLRQCRVHRNCASRRCSADTGSVRAAPVGDVCGVPGRTASTAVSLLTLPRAAASSSSSPSPPFATSSSRPFTSRLVPLAVSVTGVPPPGRALSRAPPRASSLLAPRTVAGRRRAADRSGVARAQASASASGASDSPSTPREPTPSPPEMENVWDYPRPPRLEPNTRRLRVLLNNIVIADTRRGYRVLETSHPPTYYIPTQDVALQYLCPAESQRTTFCEFKGQATYYDVKVGWESAPDAAWAYNVTTAPFAALKDHITFYAGQMDECWVDDWRVQPQEGDFYGGWITPNITGRTKGGPGTAGW